MNCLWKIEWQQQQDWKIHREISPSTLKPSSFILFLSSSLLSSGWFFQRGKRKKYESTVINIWVKKYSLYSILIILFWFGTLFKKTLIRCIFTKIALLILFEIINLIISILFNYLILKVLWKKSNKALWIC